MPIVAGCSGQVPRARQPVRPEETRRSQAGARSKAVLAFPGMEFFPSERMTIPKY